MTHSPTLGHGRTIAEVRLPWQVAWADGIAPLLSTAALESLRDALARDDDRIIQECTAAPEPGSDWGTWDSQAPAMACPIGFAGWVGDGLETVAEVREFFEVVTDAAKFGGAAPDHFIDWYDRMARHEAFPALLAEVESALAHRERFPAAQFTH